MLITFVEDRAILLRRRLAVRLLPGCHRRRNTYVPIWYLIMKDFAKGMTFFSTRSALAEP